MYRILATFLLVCVTLLAAGCSGGGAEVTKAKKVKVEKDQELAERLPEPIRSKGHVVVGIAGSYPPMEFKKPGSNEFTGFDVDLARALGQKLGVEVRFNNVPLFEQLINSVVTGRIDMSVTAMTDTEQRQRRMDFIDYLESGPQLYTTKDHPDIAEPVHLCGKTVAMAKDSTYPTQIDKWSKKNCVDAGRPAIKRLEVDSTSTARLQLKQNRAEGAVAAPEVIAYLRAEQPGQFVPLQPLVATSTYGIGFKKGNDELREAVYGALQALYEDGTYDQLLAKWKLSSQKLEKPTINEAAF